jgi:hypothetical protein
MKQYIEMKQYMGDEESSSATNYVTCPRCGHRVIEQFPPLITCVACGYLLQPASPDISPVLREGVGQPPKGFFWETNLEKRLLWGRRIDTFDKDFDMPKATRKGVLMFLILLSIALVLIWLRMNG